ncbi:hypothetical protein Back11_30670 [Paenibacillus baekrokdamisoli]|uniref:Uncharacterized protein n=1 Tax=Paenibacillus baekrokdamisoli TaxID=1712516 RepID=A0A3G9ITZ9_9BACL|nr:PD40 domain-containing protein [Paenibacillus baekrokdamisoli]MBB3073042.1 TolB protein [Paenibacillus baekrokdamisoli]BBH21722.1 hypothetical protein Back11_30670 [Paenibacillus baekrokdamisoli]
MRDLQGSKRNMTKIAAAVGIVGFLLMTGCSGPVTNNGGEGSGREVIEKPQKTITIVDTEPAAAHTEIEVVKIDELNGIRGLDWLGEDKLIIDKENKKMEPTTIEGRERYPHNLYIRDLSKGESKDEALKEGTDNQGAAVLSPDKKYMFYKVTEETTGTGYIMDLGTRKTVKTGSEQMSTQEGSWNGNEQLVFPVMTGRILSSNLNGEMNVITITKNPLLYNVVQRGANLYYIGINNNLFLFSTVTKETTLLDRNVIWLIPSPDGKQLALVKRTSDTEMELTITDSSLHKKVALAKSTQVFGTSWSPDGTKLAYSESSETGGVKGVFVADVVSGKSTQIAVDVQSIADPLVWSPSGHKIITTTAVLQDNKYVFITYIITLKS